MRLRNKKTGEIAEIKLKLNESLPDAIRRTIEEAGWEETREPLIKHEKIRKAIRAWAEMNKIEKAGIQKIITEARGLEDSWYQITGQDKNGCLWKIEIHASYSETVSKDYKENMVTIAELCGEEEE